MSVLFLFVLLLLGAAANLTCAALTSREVVPLDHQAQGLSWDPENGCVYIIFRHFVKYHCQKDGPAAVSVAFVEAAITGAIVSWVDETTIDGYLFLLSRSPLDSAGWARLKAVRRARTSEGVVPIEANDLYFFVSDYKNRDLADFLIASDKRTLYLIGKLGESGSPRIVSVNITSPANIQVNFGDFLPLSGGAPVTPYFVELSGSIYFRARNATTGVPRIFRCSDANCTTAIALPAGNALDSVLDLVGPVKTDDTHLAWIEVIQQQGIYALSAFFFDSSTNLSIRAPADKQTATDLASPLVVRVRPWQSKLVVTTFNDTLFETWDFFSESMKFSLRPDALVSEPSIFVSDYSWKYPPVSIRPGVGIVAANEMSSLDVISRVGSSRQGFTFFSARATPGAPSMNYVTNSSSLSSYMKELGSISPCPPTGLSTDEPFGTIAIPLQYDSELSVTRSFAVAQMSLNASELIYYNITLGATELLIDSTPYNLFPDTFIEGTSRPIVGAELRGMSDSNTLLLVGSSPVSQEGPLIISKLDTTGEFSSFLLPIAQADACLTPFAAKYMTASPDGRIAILGHQPNVSSNVTAYAFDFATNTTRMLTFAGPVYWRPTDLLNFKLPVVFDPADSSTFFILARTNPFDEGIVIKFVDSGTPTQGYGIPASSTMTQIQFAESKCGSGDRALYYSCFNLAGPGVCLGNPGFNLSTADSSRAAGLFVAEPTFYQQPDGSVIAAQLNYEGPTILLLPYCNTSVVTYNLGAEIMLLDVLPVPMGGMLQAVFNNSAPSSALIRSCSDPSLCESGSITICSSCSNVAVKFVGRTDTAFFYAYRMLGFSTAYFYVAPIDFVAYPPLVITAFKNSDTIVGMKVLGPDFAITVTTSSIIRIATSNSATPSTMVYPYPLGQSAMITGFEVLTDPAGGFEVVLQISDLESWLAPERSRVLTAQTTFCYESTQCGAGLNCSNFECVAPPAPPVPASTPVSAPVFAPSACTGSAPTRSSVCISGTWVHEGNFTINNNSSELVIIAGPVFVNGSLNITGGVLQFINGGSITVSGCVEVSGSNASVTLPAPTQTVTNGTIPLIYFEGGYCTGGAQQFNSATLEFENATACSEQISDVNYGERSISMLFSYQTSACGQQDTDGLTVGAIVGIVLACLAIVAIIIASVVCLKFRRKVRPFDERNDSPASRRATDYELETEHQN